MRGNVCRAERSFDAPAPQLVRLLGRVDLIAFVGRVPEPVCTLIGSVFVFVQFVCSAPSFCVSLRSTAKRDQSFICAYPGFRGLHGRLSLGNPPALKQCLQVYREGTPSLAQAGYSKDRRELALAELKL